MLVKDRMKFDDSTKQWLIADEHGIYQRASAETAQGLATEFMKKVAANVDFTACQIASIHRAGSMPLYN